MPFKTLPSVEKTDSINQSSSFPSNVPFRLEQNRVLTQLKFKISPIAEEKATTVHRPATPRGAKTLNMRKRCVAETNETLATEFEERGVKKGRTNSYLQDPLETTSSLQLSKAEGYLCLNNRTSTIDDQIENLDSGF